MTQDIARETEHSEPARRVAESGEVASSDQGRLGQQQMAEDSKWTAEPVSPWRRYGARMLDSVVGGTAGWVIISYVWYLLAPLTAERVFSVLDGPAGRFADIFLTLFAAGLVNAVVLASTGSTIGKAVFGVRVLKIDGSNLGLVDSFARELKVWAVGLGFGLPLVSLVTMMIAYGKLKSSGATAWDARNHLVSYRRGRLQTALNVLGIALIIAARYFFAWLEMA